MADDSTQLDDFLSKVNEIEGLVKNLVRADDQSEHSAALKDADRFLDASAEQEKHHKRRQKPAPRDNTGVNRTVINKNAYKNDDADDVSRGPQYDNNISPEAFMSVIEQDAKARAARKAQRHKEATVIKDHGNREFQSGNYQAAVDKYTEALSVMKDYTALWTNRAQCYIKLGQYEKAIDDCDWALRVTEKCLKSYIHKGRALAALGRHDDALDCFTTALEIAPSKKTIIESYNADVRRARDRSLAEAEAESALAAGEGSTRGVVELMGRLSTVGQPAMYYGGGLRLLARALTDAPERTLFRGHGGLRLTEDHPCISRCISACPDSLSPEELDLCAAVMETLQAATTDHEENALSLLALPSLPNALLRLLEARRTPELDAARRATLATLHLWAQTPGPRAQLAATLDTDRLLAALSALSRGGSVAAGGLLAAVGLDGGWRGAVRGRLGAVMAASLAALGGPAAQHTAAHLTNLCGDGGLAEGLRGHGELWEACSGCLERLSGGEADSRDTLLAILRLLHNLCLGESHNRTRFTGRLADAVCPMITRGDREVRVSAASLLGQLTSQADVSTLDTLCDRPGTLDTLLTMIKTPGEEKAALRTVTACTQSVASARQAVCDTNALPALVACLAHTDPVVVGNSALALSHCTQLPGAAAALTHTDVLKAALVLARDGPSHSVRHNCAVLTARLSQTHARHLERLRELDGMGILHNALSDCNRSRGRIFT